MNDEYNTMSEKEKASLYILLGNIRTLKEVINPSDSKEQNKLDFLTNMVYDLQYADKPCSQLIDYISEKIQEITEDLIITRG